MTTKITRDDVRFTVNIARKRAGRHPDLDEDDCISVALLALVESSLRWDPSRGVKLTTFAYRHIVGAIIDIQREAPRYFVHVGLSAAVEVEEFGALARVEAAGELVAVVPRLLSLPPVDRDLLVGHAIEEDQEDVGRAHGISKSRASHRAREARELLCA